jgi:hypothetical protein
MEALMHQSSFPFKLTAEDRIIISRWKLRVAAVYGAILLVLVLIVASGPYTRTETETAKNRAAPDISAAALGKGRTIE